jgi:hypothetical protein
MVRAACCSAVKTGAPTIVDSDVAAGSPSELLKSFLERRDTKLRFRIVFGQPHQYADPSRPVGLLR